MRIAVISDIHAHYRALEAVLEDMAGVDYLLCAGDVTGYHRNVNEVFDRLRRADARMILGNHDYFLFNEMPSLISPDIARSVGFTRGQINSDNLALLKQLPKTLMLKIDGVTLHMSHGSPGAPMREYIFPDSLKLNQCAEAPGRIIIMGHTHWPFIQAIGGKWILNPGSVGQPRGDNGKASYVIIETKPLKMEIKYVDCFNGYDWSAVMI